MDTNILNKHLEDKSRSDITKMVDEITDILNKYDEKYDVRFDDFYLVQIKHGDNILYTNKQIQKLKLTTMFRDLLYNRYYDIILRDRTQNLLKKVELLD